MPSPTGRWEEEEARKTLEITRKEMQAKKRRKLLQRANVDI